MNSNEIKDEAKKRLENMTAEEKQAALGYTSEEAKIRDEVLSGKKNYWKLTKQEKDLYQKAWAKNLEGAHAGGALQGGFERDLQDDFGISRDDIKKMAKNPYKAKMLKDFLLVLVLNIGSAVLGATGLAAAIPALEMPAAIFAFDFARNVRNYFKFKKIQKKYVSGEMTEEEIRAEVFKEILDKQDEKYEGKGMKR